MGNILQNLTQLPGARKPIQEKTTNHKKKPPEIEYRRPARDPTRKLTQVIKKFADLWKRNRRTRIFVIYGGAGSGKSFAVAQRLCKLLCEGHGVQILVVRKTLPSLKITAYKLILDVLNDWGIPYTHNKTERTVTVGPNQIYFTGLDDPEKVKSSEYNFIWIEEATDVLKKDFLQLNLRLRRKNPDGHTNQMFLTFNPIDAHHWIQEDIIDAPPSTKIKIHHSTYLDNPFLDAVYVEELIELEKKDINYYRIYTLGLPGLLEGLIYKNFIIEQAPPAAGRWLQDADALGLDFGFNNETALVAVRYYEGRLFIKELLYTKGYTNTDLINWMKRALPNKSIPLWADNAEPARIEEIAREGFNVWPARKEVVPGIDFLKAQQLVLDPDSPNLIREFRNYKWREDKDGRVLDEPVKFRDHTCFIAGTQVDTIDGPRPIESIKPGDQIRTRRGYYPVIAAGKTGQADRLIKVTFSDGRTLTGTPEHPIWIKKYGWKALYNVRKGDKVETIYNNTWPIVRRSYIKEFFSEDTRTPSTGRTGFITGRTQKITQKVLDTFIKKFGKMQTDLFQKVTWSTTKTKTHLITVLKTLHVFMMGSTGQTTPGHYSRTPDIRRATLSTLRKYGPRALNGKAPKQEKPFIKKAWTGFIQTGNLLKKFVNTAARKCKTSVQAEISGSVQLIAEHTGTWQPEKTTRKGPARYVETLSRLINTVKPVHVHKVVEINSPGSATDVYNLTVSTFHEYFANGVLSKNCDAARYAIYSMGLGEIPIGMEVLDIRNNIPGMGRQYKESEPIDFEDQEDLQEEDEDGNKIPGLDY